MRRLILFVLIIISVVCLSQNFKTQIVTELAHKRDTINNFQKKTITEYKLKEYKLNKKDTLAKLLQNKLQNISNDSHENMFFINFGNKNDSIYIFIQDWTIWDLVERSEQYIYGCYRNKNKNGIKNFIITNKGGDGALEYIKKLFLPTNDSIYFIRKYEIIPDNEFLAHYDIVTVYVAFLIKNEIQTYKYILNGKDVE